MVTICHDLKGKFGLKLKSIDDGIFVCLVADGSPAAMVGIRLRPFTIILIKLTLYV